MAVRDWSLLETVPDAVIVVNLDGTIRYANRQAESTFGYRADELRGKTVETLIPQRFRASHAAHRYAFATAARSRPMGTGTKLFGRHKDGTEFPAEICLNPIDGGITVAVVWDITERLRLEETRLDELRRFASALQTAMLPAKPIRTERVRISHAYVPGNRTVAVGGDWCDTFKLADGRVVLSIGDVFGSGLAAAVTMGTIRQSIRAIARITPDPAAILRAVDEQLRLDSPEAFATAVICILDDRTLRLDYAIAGHPLPLIRRAGEPLATLRGAGLLLGLRGPDEPATSTVMLEPGSLLVLYTDGLIEATHDSLEGEARLHQVMTSGRVTRRRNVAQAIFDEVVGSKALDDTAVMALEVASAPAVNR